VTEVRGRSLVPKPPASTTPFNVFLLNQPKKAQKTHNQIGFYL
jgi:hypothetical protein